MLKIMIETAAGGGAGATSRAIEGGLAPVRRAAAVVDKAPQLYFLISAVFHYLGPAFAVLLFTRIDVLGVAWLRIVSAAVIFAAWRKPWRAFAAFVVVGVALHRQPRTAA